LQNDEQKPSSSGYSKYLQYADLGIYFAVGVGLFTWLGILADRKCGTKALFTVLGAFLGFAGAFRLAYESVYGREKTGRGKCDRSECEDAESKEPVESPESESDDTRSIETHQDATRNEEDER